MPTRRLTLTALTVLSMVTAVPKLSPALVRARSSPTQAPPPGRYDQGRPRPTPEAALFQPRLDPLLQPYRPLHTNLKGALKGMASDILPGLAKLWIEGFERFHPGITIACDPPYGGRIGAVELIDGKIDFALVSRELIPTDREQFKARFGYEPLSIPVSGGSFRLFGFLDAIAIIASRDNPVEKITLAQFDAAFSQTRHLGKAPLRTWGDLGLTGAWAARPVKPIGVKPWNGFEEFMRQRALSGDGRRGEWRTDIPTDELVFPMTTHVSRDEEAISFTGMSFLMGGVKTLAVARDEHGPYVTPTFENVANWSYPLARVFYINVNRKPGAPLDPVLDEFIRFILSRDGQALIVKDALFLPLSANLTAKSRTFLD